MNSLPFNRIRFGLNYVPSRKWWYCWNDFQPDEIAPDLDAMAALGADHIRVMLLWPSFQPNRQWVSPAHLDRLDLFMKMAGERGLDVCVTALTGWLSGWAFRPTFDRPEDFYESSEMREAVEIYLRACAGRLNLHANFLGFDLGNELNCCWRAKTTGIGDAWMDWALGLCESLCPQAVHVNGADHQPWFYPETFSAQKLAMRPRLATIHSWIEFTGALKRGEAGDPVCTHLAPAMAALVRAYASDASRPVWLQEFGASPEWIGEKKVPGFLDRSVRAAIAGGICWITWWSSHDIRREFQFPSIEYDLGLLDTGNRVKPAGEIFRGLAHEFGGKPVLPPPALDLLPPPEAGAEHKVTFENTWAWIEAAQKSLA